MNTQHSKKILIVEDETEILFILKAFLESEGYETITAENGQEAMSLLKNDPHPNLILLDMKMPIMNGWEFADKYTHTYDHTSPIVVMTAAADVEQRAKEVHARGWVSKPFSLDTLLETIKKHELLH